MENSRTLNVARNVSFALITQGINLLLSFISRTIFIRFLSLDYLGINGLFSNILVLLSFAELGIGEAIIYSMYKPLAEKDKDKIKSLMNLYAKTYRAIGVLVILAGLSVIPFMHYIIKDQPDIAENINLLYVLFLINTGFSYFYAYRKSIIIADQKKYIVSIYQQLVHIVQVIVQIIFLLITKNYIVFLSIQIACTVLNNLVISSKAKKMYPYLSEGNVRELDKSEKSGIVTNIKALFLYKIGDVVLGGSDNVIISALIGITSIGLISNYQIIVTAFTTIYRQVFGSFTASVGNLNAIDSHNNKIYVFDRMFYLSSWLAGFFTVGMILFINPLISLWLGDEFLLSSSVVISMSIYFYIKNVHIVALTFRTTMGFFRNGRYAPLLAAILNIVLSVMLGIEFGLVGIFIASSISSFFTFGIVDPILVYKKGFNKSPILYYKKYIHYGFTTISICYITSIFINWNVEYKLFDFLLNVIIATIIYNSLFLIATFKTKEFKGVNTIFIHFMSKKLAQIFK